MSRQFVCLIAIILLLSAGASLCGAATFEVRPTFDVEIGNDAQIGPGSSSATGTGMGIRNIATRRRVSFITYDISGAKGPGQAFFNVKLSNYGHDPGVVNVYGVLESVEHLVADGVNWNTAPGVKNDPVPALDSDVALDFADLTEVLITFTAPARGIRESTETSQALADFLNSDTDGFVAFLLAPEAAANAIVRTMDYTAGPGGTWIQGEVGGQPVAARDPSPADQATDVYRDEVLAWTPGSFASTRNVYFGTSFADVNTADASNPLNVLVAQEQEETVYDPDGSFAYGQTYFWRVDEVNAADGTVYRGNVWSFTAEPVVYALKNVAVTASSTDASASPAFAADGSGLTDDLYHGTGETTMWLSSKTGPQPTWIQFQFDSVYKIEEMWAWNYNVLFESVLGLGMKDVTIEYSIDGAAWTILSETQFPRAEGRTGYEHGATIDFGGVAARSVRLTPTNNWGGLVTQYGLSEVRFFHTPVHASVPNPAAAQTGVSPDAQLQWRPGREAVSHKVYFSEDQQAVTSGTAPAKTTAETTFNPGSLLLAKSYYWRVDEINEAMSPSLWQGAVWSFTTSSYLVVEDFESYTDDEGSRIYETWIDGWDVPANGSQVGYGEAPFAERNTIHGGRQSMPLTYDNMAASYSEAECTFSDPQNWTLHGVRSLSLYFYGPAENAAAQLYLKINGTKVLYAGAADNLKAGQWTQWTLDLASVGTNLKSVKTLCIGTEGSGAMGKLFIDDIQLTP
jgi:hypothetical protein